MSDEAGALVKFSTGRTATGGFQALLSGGEFAIEDD